MNIEKIKKDITHQLNYVPEMSQTTYNALKGALDIINAIEDIKADIIRHSKICDPEFKDAFEVTVQIIDKHIAESEEV